MRPPAVANAKREGAEIQTIIDQEKGGFQLAAWDWDFYSEKVRKARYDFDEAQLQPYFEFNHVLVDGVFFAAGKLYGLTFKERKDLPVYLPDVRIFEVFDRGRETARAVHRRLLRPAFQTRRRLDERLCASKRPVRDQTGRGQSSQYSEAARGRTDFADL